jgi:hypothetical protein
MTVVATPILEGLVASAKQLEPGSHCASESGEGSDEPLPVPFEKLLTATARIDNDMDLTFEDGDRDSFIGSVRERNSHRDAYRSITICSPAVSTGEAGTATDAAESLRKPGSSVGERAEGVRDGCASCSRRVETSSLAGSASRSLTGADRVVGLSSAELRSAGGSSQAKNAPQKAQNTAPIRLDSPHASQMMPPPGRSLP